LIIERRGLTACEEEIRAPLGKRRAHYRRKEEGEEG